MNLTDLPRSGWRATLDLGFSRSGPRTLLSERAHHGPLTVQKPFYPEGEETCHAIVLHPPGGIAGGDELQLNLRLGAHARVVVTTPGATKWYRSAGPFAQLRTHIRLAPHSALEWLPQEAIVFSGARAQQRISIELERGAVFLGWEIFCLGRQAAGECFDAGSIRQSIEIHQDGEQLWGEYNDLEGDDPALRSAACLGGFTVYGTLVAAGIEADPKLLSRAREVAAPDRGHSGITALPRILLARHVGPSGEMVRKYFVELWRVLRPALLGRELCAPRIWST